MVVLSVALCTKSGKSLFARQYVDMTRGRVEGLMAAFPKLVGSTSASQHTYVETDAVRYVYHPLDKLYIVLITNKHSNIMEDLETLRLLSKLVPDICGGTSYDAVQAHVFDVLFACDEVITSGGYKEDITLRQVRTNMEMNSHDERLAQLIRQSKINEAKETAHAKAKELAEQKRLMARTGLAPDNAMPSYASGSRSPRRSYHTPAPAPAPAAAEPSRRPKRGMKLGKKEKRGASLLQNLMKEEHIPASAGAGAGAGAASAVEEAKHAGPAVDVDVVMTEKLNIVVVRDGTVRKMQVNGALTLTCNSEGAQRLHAAVALPDDSGFQFQPHPNVSKPAWKSGVLTLKDTSRTFPVGTPVSVLRWRMLSREDSSLPIALNVWPDVLDDGVFTVTVDYTLQNPKLTVSDFTVRIPLPPGATPAVNNCDGVQKHLVREDVLEWSQPIIDASSKEGTLEFEVECDDDAVFFPVEVSFMSQQTLCPLEVSEASALDEEGSIVAPATFKTSRTLTVAKYVIEAE